MLALEIFGGKQQGETGVQIILFEFIQFSQ
jgi:hypothetical protein